MQVAETNVLNTVHYVWIFIYPHVDIMWISALERNTEVRMV